MDPVQTTCMRTASTVLVNFVVVNRFQQGWIIPYVHGFLNARGEPCRKLGFGVAADAAAAADAGGVALTADATRELLDVLRQTPVATRVLFSRRPAEGTLCAVREAVPDLILAHLMDDMVDSVVELGSGRVSSVWNWLGDSRSLEELSAAFEPDFSDAPSATTPAYLPLPTLLAGPLCEYRRTIDGNALYTGLDLEGTYRSGCSFCSFRFDPGAGDSLDRFERLLGAAWRTASRGTHEPRFKVIGEDLLRRLDECAERIAGLHLAPARFLMEGRAVVFDRHRAAIEDGLRRLRREGHVLEMVTIGFENFSQPELDRFHKGVTTTELLRAVDVLLELEERFEGTLDLRSHGAWSNILFTPWSALEDIELNLRIIDTLELRSMFGKLLWARLRLYPDLPIHRLAKKDGLLVPSHSDPVFDTARWSYYRPELPWRFRERGLAAANALLARITPLSSAPSDPLRSEVQSWLETRGGHDPGDVPGAALEIVERVAADPGAAPSEVLAALRERHAAGAMPRLRWVEAGAAAVLDAARDIAMNRGLRPVAKVEGLTVAQAADLKDALAARLGGSLALRTEADSGHTERVNAFYGLSERAVAAAAAASRSMMGREAAIGTLLGYPTCCARAFAAAGEFERQHTEWMLARKRLAFAGEVPRELMVALLVFDFFVPCSLTCAEALGRGRAVLQAVETTYGEDMRRRLEALADRAVLMRLAAPGNVALLALGAAGADRFSYELVLIDASDPAMLSLSQGDAVRVYPHWFSVEAGGVPVRSLVGDATLFDRQRVWGERELRVQLFDIAAKQVHRRRYSTSDVTRTSDVLFRAVRGVVEHRGQQIERRMGVRVEAVSPCADGSVAVVLASAARSIRCLVAPSGNGGASARSFLRGKVCSLAYEGTRPLERGPLRRAVEALFVLVEHRLGVPQDR